MTPYLERTLAGETPTPQEWNDHMIAFHRVWGRWGENLICQMQTAGGETSYDLLASRIKALSPQAKAILDIGCGDGTLLVRIANLFGPDIALTGIDLVETDIADARKRLPAATFLCGDALALDMDRESQDVVTSHLAFMAMPAIERVLARARSALRESGVLAFVIEDPLGGGTIFELLGSAVAALRRRFRGFTPTAPGRAPMERAEDVRALLARAGFARVSIEPFTVSIALSARQLWHVVERTYPFGLLDAALRNDLRDALRAEINAATAGAEKAVSALRLVSARVLP